MIVLSAVLKYNVKIRKIRTFRNPNFLAKIQAKSVHLVDFIIPCLLNIFTELLKKANA